MAIRPDDAANLAKGMRETFVEAEELLLHKTASALAKGLESPSWVDDKLLQTQAVLRSVDSVLDDLAMGIPGAVERVTGIAYNRGIATAGADLTRAGMSIAAFQGVPDTGAVAAITAEVVGKLDPMRFQIKRAIADVYQQVVTQTAAQVTTGVLTRREASRLTLTRLAKNGVTGFLDRSGRKWEMGAYAEQAVRTASMNASLQGHTDKMRDLGIDTMIVSNAPEECKVCRPWEGRIVSLSGHTTGRLSDGKTVKGSLAEAKADGLFHNNCRHSMSIYLPGITKGAETDTKDEHGDKLRQQQRAHERRIRETKREKAIAEAFDPAAGKAAGRKLRAQQADFRHWREANGRKDLSYRTSLAERSPKIEAARTIAPDLPPIPDMPEIAAANAIATRADDFTLATTADWTDEDFMDLMGNSWDDPELLDRIQSIMEAREVAAAPLPAVTPIADVVAAQSSPLIDPFTGKAYADPDLNPTARPARKLSKAQVLEEDHQNYVSASYARAEEETSGVMLNEVGKRMGVSSYQLFTSNAATARKYASEELVTYWETYGRHSKGSFDYMMNQTPSSRKAFEATRRAGFGGPSGRDKDRA